MTETIQHQIGALPYRITNAGSIEILLVTTRGTGRWIVPKGWPMTGMSDSKAAAQEAYEEAGVLGQVAPRPIGTFLHEKQADDGDAGTRSKVTVYPLRVTSSLSFWKEANQRQIGWVTPEHAMEMVQNDELRALIDAFAGKQRHYA